MPACARRRLLDHYRVMAFGQALRLPTEETNLSVSGRAWRWPSLYKRSVFSVPGVSPHGLPPFRSRRCKTHVPVRVGWQNLKGFLDPYAIRS